MNSTTTVESAITNRPPLLRDDTNDALLHDSDTLGDASISSNDSTLARHLYISHCLSTWNSRVFEFGSVLYLASIFSNTLLPMSVYALVRGVSAIVFAPAIGRFIDSSDRLTVVRTSIVPARCAVAVSCAVLWLLNAESGSLPQVTRGILLGLLATLACVEKVCSVMNTVSVEKDWLVIVARDDEQMLQALNSQMRRIDLICKLLGPFVISIIDGISTNNAILVNLTMSVVSVFVEYYTIAKVYRSMPALQLQPNSATTDANSRPLSRDGQIFSRSWHSIVDSVVIGRRQLTFYFHHPAFLPSFACALLYLTVLSFGGQMVMYLLSVGYTSFHIAIARTVAVAFEMSATWITPAVMSSIGPIRAGVWLINWQIMCLAAGAIVFWSATDPFISTSGLVGGTILSRVGLRGFDLSAQIIVQEEVEPEHRGSFSSIEAAWQNAFELCSFVMTIVFSRADDFIWPALASCLAVFVGGSLYTVFVRNRRGHLLHMPACMDCSEMKGRPGSRDYEMLASRP